MVRFLELQLPPATLKDWRETQGGFGLIEGDGGRGLKITGAPHHHRQRPTDLQRNRGGRGKVQAVFWDPVRVSPAKL